MRIVFLVLMLSSFNLAKGQSPEDSSYKENQEQITKMEDSTRTARAKEPELNVVDELLDEEKAYNEHYSFTIKHNIRVFHWQYVSTIILFFVVILIVLTGLYLSYLQFRLGEKMLTTKHIEQQGDNKTIDVMSASLEMNTAGFKINTAVIGLVILVVSLSFFFLYLKYVYPVDIVKNIQYPTEAISE